MRADPLPHRLEVYSETNTCDLRLFLARTGYVPPLRVFPM